VGFSRRFLRAYVDLRRRLARVRKGQIRSVRYVFSSDAQNWSAVSTYLGDEARGGGLLDDIVSHQLDLLPWLLGLEIQEISSEGLNAADDRRAIRCHVKFETGLVAQCEARHIDRYLETVTVELEDRMLFAHWRQGVREVWHRPSRRLFYRRLAALPHSAREAFRRRSNPIADSFVRQWATIAAVVQGRRPRLMGADASSGLQNVQALYACRQSLGAGGRWMPVPGETGSFV
jgi:predicted dehydrogenase